MRRLAAPTLGFIVSASLLFAAISVSTLELWAFPVIVSLWTALVWVLSRRGIEAWSVTPHQPARVACIVIGCTLVALVALALSIGIGLALLPR